MRLSYPALFRYAWINLIASAPLLLAYRTHDFYRWITYATAPLDMALLALVGVEIEFRVTGRRWITSCLIAGSLLLAATSGYGMGAWKDYPVLEFENLATAAVEFAVAASLLTVLLLAENGSGYGGTPLLIMLVFSGVGAMLYLSESLHVLKYYTGLFDTSKAALCFVALAMWARRASRESSAAIRA